MFSFKSSINSSPGTKDAPDSRFIEESDMQEHLKKLQGELTREKQEKMRALDEVEDLKKNKSMTKKLKADGSDDQLDLADRLQQLEGELDAAKDSERNLLVSLEAQTKKFEQIKVSLEEAKLEITSLQDSKKNLEAALSSSPSREPTKKFRRRGMMSSFANRSEIETWSLQHELKLAVEYEEKCKKAMDDLAIALKEQTKEAREAKAKLSLVQAELGNSRTEVENLKASLAITEEKLRLAVEEAGRLKFESDELAAASKEKERGLIDCIKMFEGELTKGKEENDKLIESQRVIRDENLRLREMLKHAVSEANVARESLEIARVENSRLNEHISEKESTLQIMMQEYKSLNISESAARSSIKELKDTIDTMFNSESTKISAEESSRDIKRSVAEDDVYSDVDIRNPSKQKKKTVLRKFGDIMKKISSQNAG